MKYSVERGGRACSRPAVIGSALTAAEHCLRRCPPRTLRCSNSKSKMTFFPRHHSPAVLSARPGINSTSPAGPVLGPWVGVFLMIWGKPPNGNLGGKA